MDCGDQIAVKKQRQGMGEFSWENFLMLFQYGVMINDR